MTKNLHIIFSDPVVMGSVREDILERYKKLYSGYKIYLWTSSICDTLIEKIPFVKKLKENKLYDLVDSYVAVSVISEMGGIAVGSDVYPNEKISEELLDRTVVTRNTSSGCLADLSCLCYCDPNDDTFSSITKFFRQTAEKTADRNDVYNIVNSAINNILTSKKLSFNTPMSEDFETDSIRMLNARQYGFFDYMNNDIISGTSNDIKMIKLHKSELKDTYSEKMSLYYMVFTNDTDYDKIKEGIDDFVKMDTSTDIKRSCLALIVDSDKPVVNDCISYIKENIPFEGHKFYKVICLGSNRNILDIYKDLPDTLGPIFHNVEICRNMLFGSGKLTNPVGSPWAVK